jgi:hypothetical protein
VFEIRILDSGEIPRAERPYIDYQNHLASVLDDLGNYDKYKGYIDRLWVDGGGARLGG